MKKKPCKSCKEKENKPKTHVPPLGLTIFAFITALFAVYGFVRVILDLIDLF
jgi:hypothetical protein|tara:strand:+ start:537 stop:692 length:156 start_codon:yes stop_codon:yes gene_type:complete